MDRALKIYLAGPDVFLADARRVGQQKQQLCREFGFEGLFPLDHDEAVGADAAKIFRANCSLMRRADIGLCNLTPFRSPSADPGTVFELGFLFAQGKPVYGYTSAAATYRERVAAALGSLLEQHGQPWDRDGYAVENFGLGDNLMIVRAIQDSGGVISAVEENAELGHGASLPAFRAFKACLEIISKRTRQADIDKAQPSGKEG
ncbi:MAG TPA: nucleoside 2-deoxyribosyltransferase [Methylomirabilota bacterium]|nr:nucleoside 2-deoxyribosyltransferase [Methylomirabilota bacterium]